ncbi:MAG: nucleotidyltransferase family protein [Thiomicrospira sp.]|uniref:nucleotidyltransferase family protein n=1 Tax=Thiomicrospira sp. TaxID=935 RepID=UPI0019DA9B12|nr:nucleotidyltransferase family protein [Thiomicrospira sp.]MBE0494059.1 nucleotidyltransferase family protein [Thiomicrospira sp.]
MNLHDWTLIGVEPESSVKHTLEVMDRAALQIALVITADQTLVGTVTDGDIRRGLLAGFGLESEIQNVMNKQPMLGLENESALVWQKRIAKHQLRHLPIVTQAKKILGLFYQKQTQSALPNAVVLMLGGMGTRLRPLTENIPKPMLPVGNQPILETIVRHIAEQGFEEFYFCINYLGQQIRDYFGDGEQFGVQIHYVEETERMGTAGALSLLPNKLTEPFIVMNGDLLTKIDLKALLKFHQDNDDIISACMREYSQQVPYGVIEMDGHQINQLVEKPIYRYFVNAGIYAISPKALDLMPSNEFFDMTSLIEKAMAENNKVGGFPLTEYWMDIGQMPDYYQAQADYEVHFQKR